MRGFLQKINIAQTLKRYNEIINTVLQSKKSLEYFLINVHVSNFPGHILRHHTTDWLPPKWLQETSGDRAEDPAEWWRHCPDQPAVQMLQWVCQGLQETALKIFTRDFSLLWLLLQIYVQGVQNLPENLDFRILNGWRYQYNTPIKYIILF